MTAARLRLLVEARRGGLLESLHRVSFVAVDAQDRVSCSGGDPELPVFWRSAAKFFQALPVVGSGAADRFGFTAEELAICCGSHDGADEHVETVARILQRIGATAADLHCGPHAPMSEAAARALRQRREEPTRLHNNCSGKHAGMLAVCRARGWPFADYNRLAHPLQQDILGTMSEVTSVPAAHIQTAVDGCGAVVFRTPLVGIARAFRRFAADRLPPPHADAGRRIHEAIRAAPRMVAGAARLCTRLVEVTAGRLVGKVGAEGIYGLGGHGLGVAVKIEDGGGRALNPAVCQLARHLGLLDAGEMAALGPLWEVSILNHQKERAGEIAVVIEP